MRYDPAARPKLVEQLWPQLKVDFRQQIQGYYRGRPQIDCEQIALAKLYQIRDTSIPGVFSALPDTLREPVPAAISISATAP
jgi:hypothetical protein